MIKGKVQGVFFREFAKQNASKLGITGYAKNLGNGDLEILAQGEENKLNQFVKLCKLGPLMAKISAVDNVDEKIEEDYEYFDIRY